MITFDFSLSKQSLFFRFVYLPINLFMSVDIEVEENVVIRRWLAYKAVQLQYMHIHTYVLEFLSIYAPQCVVVTVCTSAAVALWVTVTSSEMLRRVCCCSTPINCWSQTPGKQEENWLFPLFEMKKKTQWYIGTYSKCKHKLLSIFDSC